VLRGGGRERVGRGSAARVVRGQGGGGRVVAAAAGSTAAVAAGSTAAPDRYVSPFVSVSLALSPSLS
jgi:hypothetical protein